MWRIPNFRRIWGAGLGSRLGAEVSEIAFPALALATLGASALEASWVRAAVMAPFLVVTLWFGVLVDRLDNRRLMITADLARAGVLAAVVALALTDSLIIPVLIAAVFLVGCANVLHQLAEFAIIPRLLDKPHLVPANAAVTATESSVVIAGAGVGGVLVQALTAPLALASSALGYLVSAVLVFRTSPTPGPGDSRRPEGSAARQAREGLRLLLGHRILRPLALEATFWNFGNEVFMLALAVFLLADEGPGPLVFGLIVMTGGVGAFAGSLAAARATRRFGYGRSLLASLLLGNTAPFVGVVASWQLPGATVPFLLAAFFLSGIGVGIADSQSTVIRQVATHEEIRGRANASYRLISWGALSLGAGLGGVLVTVTGIWPAALFGTTLMALASLLVALSPVRRIREIDSVSPPGEA